MPLDTGDPAPWFIARCTSNERYHFNTVGGRYVVLCFLASAGQPYARAVMAAFLTHRKRFDDDTACFFGVSADPADERERRLREAIPGYRFFWDFDLRLSRLYRVHSEGEPYRQCTVVLDPTLRVAGVVAFDAAQTPAQHVASVLAVLDQAHTVAAGIRAPQAAPVLLLPRIFEPDFCRHLIECYEAGDPRQSGFMREIDGKTVTAFDDTYKRRRDVMITDPTLRAACRAKLISRLKPEIYKAFQFTVTYAERYNVARYDGEEGGFFRPHRDNTTRGTAHRRFAVTLNLNTGEYEGGALRFPEYGQTTYEAPLGGAVVFSCSLLHEATPVTRGTRYAFLPFLYDDAAAAIREQNLQFVKLEEGTT